MSDWITRPVAELHITPGSIIFTGTVSGPHKGTAMNGVKIGDMVAQQVEVIDVDNGKVWCSGDNTGSPVPPAELAPWPDAERLAHLDAALRDIRTATTDGHEWARIVRRIGDILDAAGY